MSVDRSQFLKNNANPMAIHLRIQRLERDRHGTDDGGRRCRVCGDGARLGSVARFADYNSSQDLSAVETQLVQDISKQLAQDLFDKTLGNW